MRIKIQTSFVQYKQNKKTLVFCNLVKFKWSTKKLVFSPTEIKSCLKWKPCTQNFYHKPTLPFLNNIPIFSSRIAFGQCNNFFNLDF